MLKTQDTIGRWVFHEHTPSPIRNFKPNARQIRWMQFLNLHGPLSSVYLYEYTRQTHRSADTARRSLRKLFDGQMVYKPRQQRATDGADGNFHVYDLTAKGIKFLKDNGYYIEALRPSGHWVHQYMVSCITASIHINCDRRGYRFIPAHEILLRAGNGLSAEVPFQWKGKTYKKVLTPDSLCAIDYGGSFLSFIVEADRNTEANDPKTPHRKSVRRSVKQYREFVGREMYKKHYALNCPAVVLNISVSRAHNDFCLDIVGDEIGSCRYLAYGLAPMFQTPYTPPRELLDIFDAPLERRGKVPFTIEKSPD